MYTKIVVTVIVVCCLLGCKKEERSASVLSEGQMVHAIIELYLAEERAEALGIQYDSVRKIFPQFESRVFNKLGITDSVFKRSFEYYIEHPKKLDVIYTAVVDSLSLRAQALSIASPKSDVAPQ
jgi:hypothetical protein